MSYAAQPPAPAPIPVPRRPVIVDVAGGLLAFMGLVGLAYAIATLAVVPGTLDRFRDGARGGDAVDIDGYVTVVWMFAALATVLAVILIALYLALAVALRRGSSAARIGTWVACGLGLLFGCGSTVAVTAQRSGTGDPSALGVILSESYPGYWIGLNLTLAVAQMVGYLLVAGLLLAAPGHFFGRGHGAAAPTSSAYGRLPTLGGQPPGSGYSSGPGQPLGSGYSSGSGYPPGAGQSPGQYSQAPYPPAAYPPGPYQPGTPDSTPSVWAAPGAQTPAPATPSIPAWPSPAAPGPAGPGSAIPGSAPPSPAAPGPAGPVAPGPDVPGASSPSVTDSPAAGSPAATGDGPRNPPQPGPDDQYWTRPSN
jgi:hypothetical protein